MIPDLLFAGTEFGVFFTVDGGTGWVQLDGGMPDHRRPRPGDPEPGRRPGRRHLRPRLLHPRRLQPVARASAKRRWAPRRSSSRSRTPGCTCPATGWPCAASRSRATRTTRRPTRRFGAVFTYYLKDGFKSRAERRREAEKEKREAGEDDAYPDWDELRAEDREETPTILLTVRDADGNVVRRLTGPTGKGFHRVAWDLRYPPASPTSLEPFPTDNPFRDPPSGPLAAPGTYTVELASRIDGEVTVLAEPDELHHQAAGPGDAGGRGPAGAAGLPAEGGPAAAGRPGRRARRRRGGRAPLLPPPGDRRHAVGRRRAGRSAPAPSATAWPTWRWR